MLNDLLREYKLACDANDEKAKVKALNDLSKVGMDAYTVKILIRDLFKED